VTDLAATRADIERWQLERLNGLLLDICFRNPFYRQKLADVQSRLPLLSLSDLRLLPYTTKAELMEDQALHPPFGSNLSYPLETYTHLHQTSGTTGRPLRVLDDHLSWRWWGKCWGDVYQSAGVGRGDRVYLAFSFGPFIGFWAAYYGAELIGAMPIPGGGQSSAQRLDAILENRATVLVCTPTYALHLAAVARERDIDLHRSGVRATVHAGEPGASIPSVRARIEDAWSACCYDHAGLSEVGAHSYSCRRRNGLHLNEGEFVFEVNEPGTGEPATEGELIVTNLGRTGMPAIRYRTGDVVRLAGDPCPCGNPYRFLPGGMLGRIDSMVVVRGVNVFPSALESVVREFPEIEEFQIVLYTESEMTAVRLEVEAPLAVATALSTRLRDVLQLRVEVEPVAARSLPRFELKARRLRDERR
jgi:phenylacetate-CoA ligase